MAVVTIQLRDGHTDRRTEIDEYNEPQQRSLGDSAPIPTPESAFTIFSFVQMVICCTFEMSLNVFVIMQPYIL